MKDVKVTKSKRKVVKEMSSSESTSNESGSEEEEMAQYVLSRVHVMRIV